MSQKVKTLEHIKVYGHMLDEILRKLVYNKAGHDKSKLEPPEEAVFEEYTQKLKDTTYGSEKYKQYLKEMGPALKHHYDNNPHHPEHFLNGIRGMSLMEIVEMLCDWKAASLRHADGNLRKSIEINQERFGYTDELKQIFLNTAEELRW